MSKEECKELEEIYEDMFDGLKPGEAALAVSSKETQLIQVCCWMESQLEGFFDNCYDDNRDYVSLESDLENLKKNFEIWQKAFQAI